MSHLLDTNICAAHFRRPGGLAHRFFQHGGGLFVPTRVAQVAGNLGLKEAESQIESYYRWHDSEWCWSILRFTGQTASSVGTMSDKRREFTDQRYVFFLTFSVARRRNLLDLDHPKRIVLGVLNHQLERMQGKCVGFVIMPNHVHVLLWLPESWDLQRFVHGWKRMSSFHIRKWYADHAPNYFEGFGSGDRFWQPKSYCFHVYSEAKIHEKLEYMHLNPQRAGLVKRAVDRRWSSARWYVLQRSVGVPIHWIECC